MEPLKSGGINVIFFSKMYYDMGSGESTVFDLHSYLSEKYGKDIAIEVSLRENKVAQNTRYVSIDEAQSKINMHIDIEQ